MSRKPSPVSPFPPATPLLPQPLLTGPSLSPPSAESWMTRSRPISPTRYVPFLTLGARWGPGCPVSWSLAGKAEPLLAGAIHIPHLPSTLQFAKDFVIVTAQGPWVLALCRVCAELFTWVTRFPP